MDIIYIKGKMQIFNKVNLLLDTGNSLKKKVLVGSFWLYMLQGLTTGLLLIQTIILARLLTPKHFGIIGIFMIFSAALEGFTNTGLRKGLVQRKNIDNDFLDTAWTVFIVRGIIISSLVFLGSSLVVKLFNTPEALPVIKVLGFSLLLQGFYNTGTVYFSRELVFFKQFLWKSGDILANFLVSIPLAFVLRNEWAMVWGVMAGSLVGVILSFSLHSYRPKLRFRFDVFKELFDYGKWLLFSNIVMFFSKQLDKILVARLLGETLFGIYIIAGRVARVPELMTKPLPNALFPAYAKFQDDPKVVKEKYKTALRIISLFYIPLIGGMIVMATPFISIFLGDKWIKAALPMQILILAMSIKIITTMGNSLFNAMGKTNLTFKVNYINLIVLSILVYPLVRHYGVNGAALCYLIMSIAGFFVWKIEISKLIGFRITDLSCMLFSIFNTIFIVLMISYINHWLNIDHPGIFLCTIVFGVVVYFSIGFVVEKVTGLNFSHDVIETLHTLKQGQYNK
jgi:lipopolysaccharide exporter